MAVYQQRYTFTVRRWAPLLRRKAGRAERSGIFARLWILERHHGIVARRRMRWLQERAESCVTLPRGHDQRVDRTATQLTRGRSVGLYDRSMAPEVPFRRSCSGGAQPGGHDYFFVCGAAQKAARVDLGHTCNEYHRSSKNHAVTVSTASTTVHQIVGAVANHVVDRSNGSWRRSQVVTQWRQRLSIGLHRAVSDLSLIHI